ncbi:MAG: cysteine dioxygenase [Burkholderiales bacterium]|nr:cysteine dioxygenase [Burkholderiales bacterium]
MTDAARFREFIARFSAVIDRHGDDEAKVFAEGAPLLAELVRHDDWLPEAFAREAADSYRQYLLYCDPRERFSVVSFVWGPGQRTPVHDHTVWGMVGVLRGAETCEEYAVPEPGAPMRRTGAHRVAPGEVDKVSPTVGDIHVVANALPDRPSISIHVYGANIGAVARHVFDPATGRASRFVSGYHNATLPNFWDRSAEVRARSGA